MKWNNCRKIFSIVIVVCLSSIGLSQAYAAKSTSSSALATLVGNRDVTVVNNCPTVVYLGVTGGSAVNKHPAHPGDTTCTSDRDCFTPQKCLPTGGIKQCFWPDPTLPTFELQPSSGQGSTTTIQFPIYDQQGTELVWGGGITGRLNCVNGVCETADCGKGPNGGCAPTTGFSQPASPVEFTLAKTVDYYDITLINGVNMPISMTPNHAQTNDNAYWCGNPGSNEPVTAVNGCQWTFTPPAHEPSYLWVSEIAQAPPNQCKPQVPCTQDADCSGGQQCGLAIFPGCDELYQKSCGKPLGYWTADQICASRPDIQGTPFDCNKALAPPQQSSNFTDLYKCTAGLASSCYQQGAQDTCCGCTDWSGIVKKPSAQCLTPNTNWTTNSQPKIQWLKQACPTAYTYPYDDPSSLFTCSSNPHYSSVTGNMAHITRYTKTIKVGKSYRTFVTIVPDALLMEVEQSKANKQSQKSKGQSVVNNINYTITFCPTGQNLFSSQ